MSTNSTFWRSIARFVAALFLLRALLPPGFMPDLGALHEGRVEITLCTAEGLKSIFVDQMGQQIDSQSPPKSQKPTSIDHCPFGWLNAHGLLPPITVDAASLIGYAAVLDPLWAQPAGHASAQGPPLGSRAPPARIATA